MQYPQKVTMAFLAVIGHLVAAPEGAHGYQIARATGYARGTVSVVLRRLVAAGWATGSWDTGTGPGRIVVKLTEMGIELVQKTLIEHAPTPNQAAGS
jgi:DNA-binding PadR family transcriptional regulator